MGRDPWGFDEGRQALARRLQLRRRRLAVARLAVNVAFLVVLLAGGSVAIRIWFSSWRAPVWAVSALFLVVLEALLFLLGFPFSYAGLRLERAYGLSTQKLSSWLGDLAKSLAFGLVAVLASGLVLLWLIARVPTWWWVAAWALGTLVSWILSFLAPVVIAPLFFRFRPLQDPALRARFEELARRAGVPVLGIFEMRASAKTRRSNAAVVGFARTRRIVVTDTMLEAFTPDEVETVLAHELGHQRHRDPLVGIGVGAAISFILFGIAAAAYLASWQAFGFAAPDDVAGLPLLAFYASLVSGLLGPPELAWSRRREARADRFSLDLTRASAAFASAMVKLHDQNLGVADPKPWEVWLFYSHPPGRARVESARSFAALASPSI